MPSRIPPPRSRWPWPLRRWGQRLRYALTRQLLCDRCPYNYRDACRQPARPNARACPDYRPRPR